MSDKKPLILITNDDGYQAKGIAELTNAMKGLGDIVV
ncbi:MAG: 5'/3'-nucleotidase SurE, partial [Fermentimonas sp.]|nr:5'/3'-nucleotidase SurE [Fermentimonas sp.]